MVLRSQIFSWVDLQLQLWTWVLSFYYAINIKVGDKDRRWWKIWDTIPKFHKAGFISCLKKVFRNYLSCLMSVGILPLHAQVFSSCWFLTKPAISEVSIKSKILTDPKNKPQAFGVLSAAFYCVCIQFNSARCALGVRRHRPRLLGEDCDCEETRTATLFFVKLQLNVSI
jgi:hypothetical protein